MKKIVAIGVFLISAISYASWWGDLNGGARAAIIGGSAIILNEAYQNSELKHQRDLDRLDTEVRRDYERQAVIENARRKYSGSGVPARLERPTANNYSGRGYYENQGYSQGYNQGYSGRGGRVVYSDGRTQIIELADGTRITLNQ